MYYAGGRYEAYASPVKPIGAKHKQVYLIGSGLAALSGAFFLLRDAQMDGSQIHILEKNPIPGGACDGYHFDSIGFVMRGERQMDEHYECLWDLMRSIPSQDDPGLSLLDEFYRLNKKDPNYSLCRATEKCGQDAHVDSTFGLSANSLKELTRFFLTPDEKLQGKSIQDVLSEETLLSNFWFHYKTVYAFENWHSALELKRYLRRFAHQLDGLADMTAFRFTKYNQYEALILPILQYLEERGVQFEYNVNVTNVVFDTGMGTKAATRIDLLRDGQEESIDLTEDDLVFISIGGSVENSTIGSQTETAIFNAETHEGDGWELWKRIAEQDPSFGHPEVFCSTPEQSNRMSATIMTLDRRIVPYIKKICKRDPFSGKTVTGGIVTCRDSGWLLNWSVSRQPQFRAQDQDKLCIWLYGAYTDKPGNYITKTMRECTGIEICEEWLYHLGVPIDQIEHLAQYSANTVPVMMPYITSQMLPRSAGDRPAVVPEGAVNFAFIGQFAETPGDAVFTAEYSVRTAMEAVYSLLRVDRAVPEVMGSISGLRTMLGAWLRLRDGRALREMNLNWFERRLLARVCKKLKGTELEKLLEEYKLN
ncbi:MAG: oleate hydratase [Lachnospiraceae bacterium]|nr:oleate hydratase [Lachnospiraceae bacterium]